MSELMRPLPFDELVAWVQSEYKRYASVFGIRREKFFRPANPAARIPLFGAKISSPIGPAAGPHSQLAQNILAAYLSGARVIELKTVQTMDGEELRKAVARPCINAADEGYNVEWSTELTVPEAQEEYIKAWFLCHVFAKEFGLADTCDFVFNMSAGYSLEGIKSAKIDLFIEGLKNAETTAAWKRCHDFLAANAALFDVFTKDDLDAISPEVSISITLSTLHGCPREEIEKIAACLITEKKLHTCVKCNPTLLGYEKARELLNGMGYDYVSFDNHHFKNDLQFDDAVEMLKRLKKLAAEQKLDFGVKLTNTFPVEIKQHELPGNEMYMSGRALFPLSINAAKMLSDAFGGELAISYSGGADYYNLKEILETGIMPVTLATTILKPGGYERFGQLAQLAEETITGMIEPAGGSAAGASMRVNVNRLNSLVESLPQKKRYRKEYRTASAEKTRGTQASLPLFDCVKAPCVHDGCPIHQRIPEYLAETAAARYDEAFRIIALDNTAPSTTGTICDHKCQYKCTRLNYEDPLQIRQAKLIACERAQDAFTASLVPPELKTKKTAAVIGAGPAGIAAAVFLRRSGVPVTVYEKRESPFGAVHYVIPSFRISAEAVARDFRMAEKLGVQFVFNAPEFFAVQELQKKHDFIVIAIGAWKEAASPVKHGQEKLIDAMRFLEDSKKTNCALKLGKRVAVIGGGDVAMDCARAAKRNTGVESVTIVYRRTREFMPSQREEQEMALAEGVKISELLAPESFSDGILSCEVMRLGAMNASGRRGVEGTGEKQELGFDTVISAVGARIESEHFARNGIGMNADGFPELSAGGESSLPNVYAAGDCKSGPATVVKAIADGKAAAYDILKKLNLAGAFSAEASRHAYSAMTHIDFEDIYFKKGIIAEMKQDNTDAYRCLSCNKLCEICVDVCPNRANVMLEIEDVMTAENTCADPVVHQVVHIDRFCNECGNCAVFCPHAGKPYREKITIFSAPDDFAESENPGFLKTCADTFQLRLEDKSIVNYQSGETKIPANWIALIETIKKNYGYLLTGGSHAANR